MANALKKIIRLLLCYYWTDFNLYIDLVLHLILHLQSYHSIKWLDALSNTLFFYFLRLCYVYFKWLDALSNTLFFYFLRLCYVYFMQHK